MRRCPLLTAAATALVLSVTATPAAPAAATPAGAEPAAGTSHGPWERTTSTVGKLIWELPDGRLGMCSGAVVEAANGSVVATAAHCAADARAAGPAGRTWFLPGYRRGLATFRSDGWRVADFHLPEEWVPGRSARDNLPHDYAFLTLERKRGRTVQETHGANRLAYAPIPEDRPVTALGYPAEQPYDGESPYHCSGPTHVLATGEAASFNVGGLLLADCPLTQGASGGPWLQDYDPATGSGTLVGVTSAGTGRGEVVGRPCPPEARALHARAAGTARGR